MRADGEEALATEGAVLEDVDRLAALATDAEAPDGLAMPRVPEPLHCPDRYACDCHRPPLLATS
jgi:hypothetical protein